MPVSSPLCGVQRQLALLCAYVNQGESPPGVRSHAVAEGGPCPSPLGLPPPPGLWKATELGQSSFEALTDTTPRVWDLSSFAP